MSETLNMTTKTQNGPLNGQTNQNVTATIKTTLESML